MRRVVLAEVDDLGAEPVWDRGRELADQGTDDTCSRTDLQGRKDVWQGRREAELPQNAPVTGRITSHQLECTTVSGVQAADRVDGYREEGQKGRDQRDRPPVLQAVRELRVRPDDNHRRDHEDRDGLRGNDPRQQTSL